MARLLSLAPNQLMEVKKCEKKKRNGKRKKRKNGKKRNGKIGHLAIVFCVFSLFIF
jgi:hypothetical protein